MSVVTKIPTSLAALVAALEIAEAPPKSRAKGRDVAAMLYLAGGSLWGTDGLLIVRAPVYWEGDGPCPEGSWSAETVAQHIGEHVEDLRARKADLRDVGVLLEVGAVGTLGIEIQDGPTVLVGVFRGQDLIPRDFWRDLASRISPGNQESTPIQAALMTRALKVLDPRGKVVAAGGTPASAVRVRHEVTTAGACCALYGVARARGWAVYCMGSDMLEVPWGWTAVFPTETPAPSGDEFTAACAAWAAAYKGPEGWTPVQHLHDMVAKVLRQTRGGSLGGVSEGDLAGLAALARSVWELKRAAKAEKEAGRGDPGE